MEPSTDITATRKAWGIITRVYSYGQHIKRIWEGVFHVEMLTRRVEELNIAYRDALWKAVQSAARLSIT